MESPKVPRNIPLGALVSIIHRTHFIRLNAEMNRFGLSSGQFLVLMHLAREQDITQETLTRRFHINKATIARAAKKLEDAGYIRRVPDPENRRAHRLFLTGKGEEIIPEIIAIDGAWEDTVLSGLSNEERAELTRLLCHAAQNSIAHLHVNGFLPDDHRWMCRHD